MAAVAGAMAAALVSMAARPHGELGVVAQADSLRARLLALAEEDAEVLERALESLAGRSHDPRVEARDFELGQALRRAADTPLAIAEAAEDVATAAADLAARIEGPEKPDAAAAALLAEAAARMAAHLVEINLATVEGDERLRRARVAAEAAGVSARRASG